MLSTWIPFAYLDWVFIWAEEGKNKKKHTARHLSWCAWSIPVHFFVSLLFVIVAPQWRVKLLCSTLLVKLQYWRYEIEYSSCRLVQFKRHGVPGNQCCWQSRSKKLMFIEVLSGCGRRWYHSQIWRLPNEQIYMLVGFRGWNWYVSGVPSIHTLNNNSVNLHVLFRLWLPLC